MNSQATTFQPMFAAPPATNPTRAAAYIGRSPLGALVPTVLGLLVALGVCGTIAALGGMQLGAAIFALLVVVLAIFRPGLVFTLALLLSPFVNDIELGVPVKVAASDLCLFLALPFIVARRHSQFVRVFRTPYWIPVTAYLALCVASTIVNGMDRDAVVSTSQMFVYLVFTVAVFAAGVGNADEILRRLYLIGLVAVTLTIAMTISRSNYILGLHKNSAGSTLSAALLVMLGLYFYERNSGSGRRSTLIVLLLLMGGLLLSLSRGAWIGAGAGGALILLMYGRVRQAIRLVLCAVPVLAVLWLMLPESQRDYATDLSASAYNVKARLDMIDYALSRFRTSPLIGVGVGLRKTYDATNVALATLAESGIIGLILFVGIYATLAVMTVAAARQLSRRDPAYALLAIGAALVLAKLLHGMVDHYWARGAILFWAGAGFILLAHVKAKQGPNYDRAR